MESRHRGHVVQVSQSGMLEKGIGDPDMPVTLRSAVKPFAIIPLIESGAADDLDVTPVELAVMAASHAGEDLHVRTLQALFRRAGISQTLLACGSEGMPLDERTAARLARDGEAAGPIRHMCSGFHAASLLLSRFAGWSLDEYDRPDHPSQLAARAAVASVFGVRSELLRTAVDDCGLLTYVFPLVEVARAFCLLADPTGSEAPGAAALAPYLQRVRDAMLAAPEMVGGTAEMLDTRLMRTLPGRIVAKSGAEGLRGIGLLPGWGGRGGTATGVVVRIEDGDGAGRANRAVTCEALSQLGALDDRALVALAAHHRPATHSPRGERIAETVAAFELAPISELI